MNLPAFLAEDPAAAWKTLVARFANGRPLCNCQCAYLSPCGKGIDHDGTPRTDLLVCADGCSANLINARNEIANHLTKL